MAGVRIAAKAEITGFREKLVQAAAALAALAASGLIMALMGYNPFDVFGKILSGSLGTAYRFKETINKAIPLCVLSLGTAVAFRMKFWNIGQEGQFYMGAYGASLIAFAFPGMSAPLLLSLMFIAGMAFGGFWALIPAFLKTAFSASETLVTLMLNYIAIKWISFLQYVAWKDPGALGFPKISSFSRAAVLPSLFGIHIGWIISLCLAALIYILLKRTKLGYEIDVIGESEATARYAGMGVARITVITIALSGALCGIAGMMQASAIERSLSDQLSGGLGFTSVIVAWLARLEPAAIVIVAFLFSLLIQGGNFLQSSLQIPASIAQVLQGIIIFFVLGSEFFTRYRLVRKN
ncbi:MAG: ABC transporter permease [Treponema sp.]|jgi:simple sugar transport system permease protein|nr:ABC transporter permease [Treponema sp.]